MLLDFLMQQGVRQDCGISVVIPFGTPVPPSLETSAALVVAFAERENRWVPGRRASSVDAASKTVALDDGSLLTGDPLLRVPKHFAPYVVQSSGIAEAGWIAVDQRRLETRWPGVYAVGGVANTGNTQGRCFRRE